MTVQEDAHENSKAGQPQEQAIRDHGLVRLEVRLPADHPLFRFPQGSRATVAREWLDIGARLAAVEERLRAIEEKLAAGAVLTQPAVGTEKQEEQVPAIDIEKFLEAFDV